MFKRFIFLMILSTISIFALASQQSIQDGIYSTKGFSVAIPYVTDNFNQKDYFQMSNKDHQVLFEMNRGYWMEDGGYSVVWLHCQNSSHCSKSDAWFKNFAPIGAKQILNNMNNSSDLQMNLAFVNGKMIRVNGNLAYQFIATGTVQNIPAIYIETDINFKGAVGMASLVQQRETNKSINAQIYWSQYNAFVGSLKKIHL